MQEQIVGGLLGAARLVLVVVAVVVALVPIGRAAVTGFCPATSAPATEAGDTTVLAAAVDAEVPADDGDVPADGLPPDRGSDQDGESGEQSACGRLDRCLPPLFSASLDVTSEACVEQAVDQLRGSMGRAFLLATVLLGAAWALRPRDGAPMLSRH